MCKHLQFNEKLSLRIEQSGGDIQITVMKIGEKTLPLLNEAGISQ